MTLFYNLLIGFFGSFIGVLPPSLINMYAAKISMKEGRKKGLLFSLGVCITVMFQTYVALLFARYIDMHPEIVNMLQKVALGIFISLTIDRKSTRLNSSHVKISYAVFCLKKK